MKNSIVKLFVAIFATFGIIVLLQSCGSSNQTQQQVGNQSLPEPHWRNWNEANNIADPAMSLRKYFSERMKDAAQNKGNKNFYIDVNGKTLHFIKDGINFTIKEGRGTGTVTVKENGQEVEKYQSFDILQISFSPSPGCSYPEEGDIVIEFVNDYCYSCIKAYYTPSNVNSLEKIQFADSQIRTLWERMFGALENQIESDFHFSTTSESVGVNSSH